MNSNLAAKTVPEWNTLNVSRNDLNLAVLTAGQSFRWQKFSDGTWTGVMKNKLWRLKQDEEYLYYQCIGEWPSNSSETAEEALKDYFQLDVDIGAFYRKWRSVDPQFDIPAKTFPAVRILRQQPTECLFSFICSSNNHIKRITSLVSKLCQLYGIPLGSLTEEDGQPVNYFSFPTIEQLSENISTMESSLKEHSFGYRAKYITETVSRLINNGGSDWLDSLRQQPYAQAKAALQTMSGVGAKVADCVCLMSLDKNEAVPVDVHIWSVTRAKYLREKSAKSLTPSSYATVGNFYRQLFGSHAGWATTVLFMSDLNRPKSKYFSSKQPGKGK